MPKSPVFEETYNHYLAEMSSLDYLSRADILGVVVEDNSLIIPLYDEVYRVSKEGVHDTRGSAVTNFRI